MMKKLIYIITCICVIMALCIMSVSAQTVMGSCGRNVIYTLDTETLVLTISGNGEITSTPWEGWQSSIKEVIIEDGVSNIPANAFSGCSSLTSITVPSSGASVGKDAFSGCELLPKNTDGNLIYLEATNNKYFYLQGVTDNNLTSCTINENTKAIGDYAFYNCSLLEEIILPVGIKSIGDYAFYNCSSLEEINIPNGTISIGDSTFACCGTLELTIPYSVTSIGNGYDELMGASYKNFSFRGCDATFYCYAGSYAESYAWNCNIPIVYLPKHTEHTYLETVYPKPTCTKAGVKTYLCECGDNYTEEISALGHDVVTHEAKAPTCTEIGYDAYETCSRCNYTTYAGDIPALGHDVEVTVITPPTASTIGQLERTCTTCGHTETEDIIMLLPAAGDMNGDGKLTLMDVMLLLKTFLDM